MIPGRPTGKGRPRFGQGRAYTPAKTREYERTVAWAAKAAIGRRTILTGPIQLTIICHFKGKEPSWHVSKPDLTNIAKGIEDAMIGIIFLDDCQVASLVCRKINSLEDKVEVFVEQLKALSEFTII